MLRRGSLAISLALTLVSPFASPAGGPPDHSTSRVRYGLVLLRNGVRPPVSQAVAESLQAGHMANIRHMGASGGLMAAGPFADPIPYRGLFVFEPESLAVLARLLAPDPILSAGRLVPEPWIWNAEAGVGEAYRRRAAANPDEPDSMVTFSMVLLRRGPRWTEDIAPRVQQRLARQRASGALVLSGPVEGPGDLRGVYVYDTDTTLARARVALDPDVRAGRLIPEIHSWWTALGVVPGH